MREHEEREVEHRLAEATGRCVILRNQLSELTTRKNGAFGTADPLQGSDVDYLLARDAYVLGVNRRIQSVERELSQRERELSEVQDEYRKARARRKAIEELRNRRSEEHYRREKRDDSRTLDEIGGTIYIRNAQDIEE
jgi:flagellar export protein FliJ